MDHETIQKQLRQRVNMLAAAGVEFVPRHVQAFVSVDSVASVEPVQPKTVPAKSTPHSAVESTVHLATQSIMPDRSRDLALLAEDVRNCSRCPELFATRTQTVFGVGNPTPEICFIGEAPGGDEDRLGEPFVGKAGQLLNRIIEKAGLKRDEIYICNILKCRPPNNRKPLVEECRNCRSYLVRQLEILAPKVILCLGGVAANNLLGNSIGITRLRGQVYQYQGIPVICTYHPSYLLRAEGTPEERKLKFECWDDVKLMLSQVGRTVP